MLSTNFNPSHRNFAPVLFSSVFLDSFSSQDSVVVFLQLIKAIFARFFVAKLWHSRGTSFGYFSGTSSSSTEDLLVAETRKEFRALSRNCRCELVNDFLASYKKKVQPPGRRHSGLANRPARCRLADHFPRVAEERDEGLFSAFSSRKVFFSLELWKHAPTGIS